eukprot:TRINITY_DN1344_c0_g1_i1.p1 TRINITY_DN1344_c0_g1~~TRINITY_DN1344_c0_g1_i1.p1  ORF type:complete len:338 (-),score=79.93 TRINITY_DN1344_c0_g1_i1:12-1025(-)
MKLAFFGTKPYFKTAFEAARAKTSLDIVYFEPTLTEQTVELAKGFDAVCLFVNDVANAKVIESLSKFGIKMIALRNAGFNNVDLDAAAKAGITVARVPAYSPYAVAEHAVAMLSCLNRHLHKAYAKVRDGNFEITGLMGFDLHGKTIGVIGTGQIGAIFARIMKHGFLCNVIAYDVYQSKEVQEMGIEYVPLDDLLARSDVISLHAPLTPQTHHIVGTDSIPKMKKGVTIINTSRGGLIDSKAMLAALKSGHIGLLGLDVYEEEADLFYADWSGQVIQDDIITRFSTFPNVLITAHQAWFTNEAITTIASTTVGNVEDFFGKGSVNEKNLVKPAEKK